MPNRVVSLIPSGTEIVAALGLSDQLVGRSHECDFPAEVGRLPSCCHSNINAHASSGEIDSQVRNSLQNALSIYHVDTGLLNQLRPTHIVTQSQCKVCAVSIEDVQQAVCEIIGSQPQIILLEPMNLQDVLLDIARTATVLGQELRGQELVRILQGRLHQIESRKKPDPPTLFCMEWTDPLMSAGNWVPELVEIAGAVPLLCQAGVHSPYLNWEVLRQADPDIIVLMPCGFDMKQTRGEVTLLNSNPDWNSLRAVRNQHVYLTDGNQYFNRPGPRLVESTEILAEILRDFAGDHTSTFQHCGTGWLRVE